MKQQKEKDLFEKGHNACAGCGSAIAMREIMKAAGKNTIISIATGCMEVVSTPYPLTSWNVPVIHSAFENAAATASGIDAALTHLGKRSSTNIIAIAGDGGCYTPGTKILTVNGLKNVEELNKGEEVFSVNPKTLEIEEAPIIKIHKYNYSNKIIKVRHNFVHFDVSLNHNIPVYDKFKKKVEVIKAYNLLDYGRSDKINIITGNLKWKGKTKKYFELPKVSYHKFSANKKIIKKIPMNLWLEFLGYWLSEGHLSIRSSKRERYNVYISQTNQKNVKKIRACLSLLPFNYWFNKDRFIISNQGLWSYLKQFGSAPNKFIPQEFKELSPLQLKLLFNALILGDGTIIKQKNSFVFRYDTISEKLKNDVIEIALKMGYRVHLDKRKRKGRCEYAVLCCNYKPTTLANLRKKNISSYDYNGKIYCPELKKNHILIIEKDGRISLNMNSFDIGLQSLSGALERGHKFLFICYDNGAYMNTGIQRSSATPKYADTTTSPYGSKIHGKQELKKNMPQIIAGHNCYVATANIAYPEDFERKIKKALSLNKPAYIQVFSPCTIGWKYPQNLTVQIARLAVETKTNVLYEIENGIYTLNMPVEKAKPMKEFLKLQGRFKNLRESEISDIQNNANFEYDKIKQLSDAKITIF